MLSKYLVSAITALFTRSAMYVGISLFPGQTLFPGLHYLHRKVDFIVLHLLVYHVAQPFFSVVVENHHVAAVLAVCQFTHARVCIFYLLQLVPVFQQVVYSAISQVYVISVKVLYFRHASYGIIVGSLQICYLRAASQPVITVA